MSSNILQLDLLGALAKRCRRCGVPFEAGRKPGRAPVYCSATCRNLAKREQTTRWHKLNPGRAPAGEVRCLQCGAAFVPLRRAAGRVPGFCSEACRRSRKLDGKCKRARATLK